MAHGVIFDIQRFSLHDGPGIRTTVFLKGCPLRCRWCHNPEAFLREPQLSFDVEKCSNCRSCLSACAAGLHGDTGGRHTMRMKAGKCRTCGACVSACPEKALRIIGRTATAEDVMHEVLKDREYYQASGGGMTLSGGEPMSQIGLTLHLLTLARNSGIHNCIETSGFAPEAHFLRVLPLTDLFLWDYKASNPEIHRQLTGRDNSLILSNLESVASRGAEILLRCPLIPGVNDSAEHLEGIARLARRHEGIKAVEILPYHRMGEEKYRQLGLTNPLHEQKEPEEEKICSWIDGIKKFGLEKEIRR